MRISHKTYCSTPDKNNRRYSVYIDPTTSKDGAHVRLYECMGTHGGRSQLFVSKFNKTPQGCTKEWAKNELAINEAASAMAMKFNHVVRKGLPTQTHARLTFLELRMARLDTTAVFSIKRNVGDCYTFEEKLDNFKRFIDGRGLAGVKSGIVTSILRRNSIRKRTLSEQSQNDTEVETRSRSGSASQTSSPESVQPTPPLEAVQPPPYCDSPPSYEQSELDFRTRPAVRQLERLRGTCPESEDICQERETSAPRSAGNRSRTSPEHGQHEFLHAFIHYHFTQTEGEVAICDLSGTLEDDCGCTAYTLTSPTLHSLGGKYGTKDRGEAGIREVIHHHTCTKWCRHLTNMTSLLESAIARRTCQHSSGDVETTRL